MVTWREEYLDKYKLLLKRLSSLFERGIWNFNYNGIGIQCHPALMISACSLVW